MWIRAFHNDIYALVNITKLTGIGIGTLSTINYSEPLYITTTHIRVNSPMIPNRSPTKLLKCSTLLNLNDR